MREAGSDSLGADGIRPVAAIAADRLVDVERRATHRLAWAGACACVLTALSILGAYLFLIQPASSSNGQAIVLLMRHGQAPGRQEPPNFDLADCRTQRNLSDTGRSEVRALGAALRNQGLYVGQVISSRWCRARETAELLRLAAVRAEPAFDNLEINKLRAAELLQAERNIIQEWRGPGALVVITHSSNLQSLSGLELGPAAMIVARPKANGDIGFALSSFSLKDPFS